MDGAYAVLCHALWQLLCGLCNVLEGRLEKGLVARLSAAISCQRGSEACELARGKAVLPFCILWEVESHPVQQILRRFYLIFSLSTHHLRIRPRFPLMVPHSTQARWTRVRGTLRAGRER